MSLRSRLSQNGFVIPLVGSYGGFVYAASSTVLGFPNPGGIPDPLLGRLDTLLSAQLAATLVGLTLTASAFVYAEARPLRESYDRLLTDATKVKDDFVKKFGKDDGKDPKEAEDVKAARERLTNARAPGTHLYKAFLSFLTTLILVLASDTVLSGQSVSLFLQESNVAVTLFPLSTGLAELFKVAQQMKAIFIPEASAKSSQKPLGSG